MTVMRAVAEREKLDVVEVFIESKSAKEPGTRPEFMKLMESIEKGTIDSILTWHINRLSRNMVDGGALAHSLHSGKLKFIRTADRFYTPEDNVLLLAIENGMATSYVHDLSKSVKRGMNGKAERGWLPGLAPLGYINNPWTKEIDPDPDRFHLIQMGWKMLLRDRMMVSEIHEKLTELGLTSNLRNSQGKPLAKSVFYSVFKNPFYAGEFRRNGQTYKGSHLPMISMAEFEEAQRTILDPRGKYRPRNFEHTYAGVFYCGKCGCKMTPTTAKKRLKDGTSRFYTYYHCTGNRGCSRRSVKEDTIDQAVLSAVDRAAIPEDVAAWCRRAISSVFLECESQSGSSSESLRSSLSKAKTRLDKLMTLFIDGDLTKEEFHELQPKLKAEVQSLERQLRRMEDVNAQVREWLDRKIEAGLRASRYGQLGLSTRKATLLTLGEKHFLEGETVRIQIDPIIEKMASFKPTILSSQSEQNGGSEALNSIWLGEIKAIWNRAHESVLHKIVDQGDAGPSSLKIDEFINTSMR